jgi:hypothetical protein
MKIKIYRNATLPGILYWHETCCLTILREERGPRVVEGSVTMVLFTLKGKEIAEVCKMHNDELQDLLCGWLKKGRSGGSEMVRIDITERYAGIQLENLRIGRQLEALDFNKRVIIRWIRWH